jgi:hypothetical protein
MVRSLKTCGPKVILLPFFFVVLVTLGCATNHVHPRFQDRITGSETITGLIVQLESTGLEMGGLKHQQIPVDESAMWVAIRAMQELFTEQQLQDMGSTPTLYLPEELIGIGYKENEIERDTKLLAELLKTAINNPRSLAEGDGLEAVRRLASRSGGVIVILGDIRTRSHVSEQSRSFGQFLAILAAAGGQYGVATTHNTAISQWAIIDPNDGNILRVLEDRMQY